MDRVDVHRSEETHRHLASLGVSTTHSLATNPSYLESTPKTTRHERRCDRESPRVPPPLACDKSAGSAMLAEARLLVHGISRVSCLPVVRPGTPRITEIASGRLIKYAFSLARVALKIGLHRLALNRPRVYTRRALL